MKVQIGALEFEVAAHRDTISVKVSQRVRGESVDVTGGAQVAETKAALKAILAYSS